MRSLLLRLLIASVLLICISDNLSAQNPFNTGLNGTVINLPCNQNCLTQPLRIPHLKTSSDFLLNSIPYNPYSYNVAGSNEITQVYIDDTYGPVIDMPFNFCFYDSIFNKCVVGSNGLLTFDVANANCGNSYQMNQSIPYVSNNICSGAAAYYPKSSIMAVFTDLLPTLAASPPDRKIAWHVEGTAPARRFVLNYYNVGMFGAGNYSPVGTNCNSQNPSTFQIVLYESLGIVDIYIAGKLCNASGLGANTILAIQNWNRDKYVVAPGKNAQVWTESNTAYRFIPSGPVSRLVSCEVQTLAGVFIATGDTVTTVAGTLDVTFPAFCPTGATGQYRIKTTFSACDNAANQIISYDTITVNKTTSLNATQAVTPTNCGVSGSGTATITVPAGIGTAPYTFVLNPGGTTLTGNSPQQFTGLTAGSYTVTVTDAGAGGCISTLPVTITSTGVLAVNFNITNTSCAGDSVRNGAINVTPPNGTPPITYTLIRPTAPMFTITQVGNGNFTNLLAGNYFLSVQDIAGCQANNLPITVAQGTPITITYTTISTSCPGATNGSITITGSSGTAPLQYSINGGPYQTNPVFPNLAAFPYFIVVQDAIGCTVPVNITVNQGTGTVTGTTTPTPTTCAGVNDGKIKVTPTSGTGPYAYSINNGVTWQTSDTFIGLAPGTYNILIREAGICISAAIPATITAGNGLLGGITPSNTTCTGATNGSISVNMNTGSGTPPFTFVLDGTVTQTSPSNSTIFNNVSAGPHSVTVTDANGCITTAPLTTTVAAGTGFIATYTPTPTGCAGVNDGKLVINSPAPGTAPFTIVLNPGAITQTGTNPVTFNNLAAGTYSAVVTDANGCQFTLSNMNVAAGAGLIASPTPVPTSCSGVNNGSISINMGSGAAPYTAIMDGTITQTSATNIISFAGVSAGPHSITVTDANGCITTTPVTTTVPAGTGFIATYTPTPTGCAGVNDGKLTINSPAPGTAPFTIVLNPGAITQTGTNPVIFNNLAAGTYSAVVTDANGCQFTLSNMNVAAGAGLIATPTPVPTSCSGVNNGSISVISNGTAPLTFVLDGTITQTSATNSTLFMNVSAGSHTITVTDANGCITTTPATTTVPAGTGFTATPSISPVLCAGGTTGSITVTTISGTGIAPFTFVLNGTATQTAALGTTFNNLTAGTGNNVVITDAVGCTFTLSNITVTEPTALTALAPIQPAKCNGGTDGMITVAASGGTSPYFYSLNNITFQPGNTFNVAAGTYTVYVRDANGCTIPPITNVNVTEPSLLTATPVTGNATCDGGNDGRIIITPAGGTSAYQYSLNGGAYQASGIFNVGPGTYDVTVRDANGCTFPVNAITVGLTNNLTYTAMTDPAPICESNTIPLQLLTNATQFAWTPAVKLSSDVVANPVASPAATTLYSVTATLGRCSISDDVLVTVIPAPIPNAGGDGDICYGQFYQLQGSGGATYTWTPSTHLSSTSIFNPQVTPDKTITYTLSVTDANGCASLVTDQVTVKVTPPIKITVYPLDTVVYAGVQIPLLATSIGTSYVWSSATGLDNPNIADPTATAPLIDGSVVIYKVTTTTSAGCQGEALVKIQVYKGPDIYVVTGFSPNGDGKNETFIPFPVGIKQLNYFRVFNRWGQLLYSTTTLNKGWDGRLGGVEQASGVYIWMVEGVTMDNKLITKKGTVTLIR